MQQYEIENNLNPLQIELEKSLEKADRKPG
jgi:hypothetical protein